MITAPDRQKPCPFPDRDLERPSNRPNIAAADMNNTSQANSLVPGIIPLYRFSSVGLLPKHPSLIFYLSSTEIMMQFYGRFSVPCIANNYATFCTNTADRSYVLFLKACQKYRYTCSW